MYRQAVGCSLLAVLLIGITVAAQANELAEAQALYRKNCSLCHGLIVPDTAQHFNLPAPRSPVPVLITHPPRTTLSVSSGHKSHGLRTPAAPLRVPSTSEGHLAFAPPYGPPLRGVYGRLAGSVTGFPYSRAFKETLQGVVWTWQRLDVWLADSQAWVPGSRMFYQQSDTEIRRKIIAYLEANR